MWANCPNRPEFAWHGGCDTVAMKRILIADDEPGIRTLLSKWLTLQGYQVTMASDGVEACRRAEEDGFDLILLDLMLPRQDGFATLLHLRGLDRCAATPILITSGEHDLAESAAALGASGFLPKPFHRTDVVHHVEEALGTAR